MTWRNRFLALVVLSGVVLLLVALGGCGGDTEEERADSRRRRACSAADDLRESSEEVDDWSAQRCGTGDLDLCEVATVAGLALASELAEDPVAGGRALLEAIEPAADGQLRDDIGLSLDGIEAIEDGDAISAEQAAEYQAAFERVAREVGRQCPTAVLPSCGTDLGAPTPTCGEVG